MCVYCENRKDLGRFDLENEENTFVYLGIREGEMRFFMESNDIDDELTIKADYCPMCGEKLEG